MNMESMLLLLSLLICGAAVIILTMLTIIELLDREKGYLLIVPFIIWAIGYQIYYWM